MSSPQIHDLQLAMSSVNVLFDTEVCAKRNIAALDDVYTADARILPPGAPMISGRDAIKQFWSDAIHALDAKSIVLRSIDVMPVGDAVVEIGAATIATGAGAQVEAKYVVYWRQEDGRWKWHVDIWNMNA
jgi:ketosteroid isomerase-like protein